MSLTRDDLQLGLRVKAADRVVRHVRYGDMEINGRAYKGKRLKSWVRNGEHPHGFLGGQCTRDPRPVEGVVVGVRNVVEHGFTEYAYEAGQIWGALSKGTRTVVLVAFDMRQEPARVWLEDVELADQENGRDSSEHE